LKKDQDDPIVIIPKELVNIQKKVSKEEILEEKCCHGEAMGNFINEENKMIGGDKSLKTFLSKSNIKHEEASVKRK
jgi:hypothetical protein